MHTMNVSEDACYQIPNVCFKVNLDFIAKENAFLQTGIT